MVNVKEALGSEVDETERIIDEYGQRITQAIEQVRAKAKELAEKESSHVIANAYQESDRIVAEAQQKAEQIIKEAEEQANKRVDSIIVEAQQKAQQVIDAAEAKVKKEAAENKKREVERIIGAAKDEAERIIAKARQESEAEASVIMAESKKVAERLAKKLSEEAREEAGKESDRIVDEAQQKAEQIESEARVKAQKEYDRVMAGILAEAKRKAELESNEVLADAKQRAENIVTEAKSKTQVEFEELTRLFTEAKQKLGQIIEVAEREPNGQGSKGELISTPNGFTEEKEHSLESNGKGETGVVPSGEDSERVYEGELQLFIAPPANPAQRASFATRLLQVPNLQLFGSGGSSDGKTWVRVKTSEPLPLLKILKEMPPVKDAVEQGKDIIVVLKAT